MSDRSYQEKWKQDIYAAWRAGYTNVCAVLPTGGGKSYTVGEIVAEHQGTVAVIAHRQELVGQLSMALGKKGVYHRIIAPNNIQKFNMDEHYRELGRSYISHNANVAVIGVDTLISRRRHLSQWMNSVTLWVTDECHHVLRSNKWGKACEMMPRALGLGVTATPTRADRQGLGRSSQGVMDVLVEGPTMRDLISLGFLTDYRIFAPPSDVDYTQVNVGKSGDYVQKQLMTAVRDSQLVGDVVQHYMRIAHGKLGVTFVPDVGTARDVALKFLSAGVPAEVITAKTPDRERAEIMRRFRARRVLQLVNVDILGEGVDVPGIEVVSMARRTLSYPLYCQQFGRALRPLPGKTHAIIIDHAGNVALHGLPDREVVWTLDGSKPRTKRAEDDVPLRYCVECTQPYEVTNKFCPWCGHYHVPQDRSKPEYVEGDLYELSPDALAMLRGEVKKTDESPEEVMRRMKFAGASDIAAYSAGKQIRAKQQMQQSLRESIGWFAHLQNLRGRSDSESYRIFYHLFGIDVLTAQTLGKPEALALANKINDYLGEQYEFIPVGSKVGDTR